MNIIHEPAFGDFKFTARIYIGIWETSSQMSTMVSTYYYYYYYYHAKPPLVRNPTLPTHTRNGRTDMRNETDGEGWLDSITEAGMAY